MFLFFVCIFIGFMGKEAIFTDKNMNLYFFLSLQFKNQFLNICRRLLPVTAVSNCRYIRLGPLV